MSMIKKKQYQRLDEIRDDKQKSAIVSALKAIQGFAVFAFITIGLLQMGALRFSSHIKGCAFRWLRTRSNKTPSEATTADFLRKTIFSSFFSSFHFSPDLDISQFIIGLQPVFLQKVVA